MEEGTDISVWLRNAGFPISFKKAKAWKWYNHVFEVARATGMSVVEARKLPKSPFQERLSESKIQQIKERDDEFNNPEDWIDVEDPTHIAIHFTFDDLEEGSRKEIEEGRREIFDELHLSEWFKNLFGEAPYSGCWVNDSNLILLDLNMTWEKFSETIQR